MYFKSDEKTFTVHLASNQTLLLRAAGRVTVHVQAGSHHLVHHLVHHHFVPHHLVLQQLILVLLVVQHSSPYFFVINAKLAQLPLLSYSSASVLLCETQSRSLLSSLVVDTCDSVVEHFLVF